MRWTITQQSTSEKLKRTALLAEQQANGAADALRNTQVRATQYYAQQTASEGNALQERAYHEQVLENRIMNEAQSEFQTMRVHMEHMQQTNKMQQEQAAQKMQALQ